MISESISSSGKSREQLSPSGTALWPRSGAGEPEAGLVLLRPETEQLLGGEGAWRPAPGPAPPLPRLLPDLLGMAGGVLPKRPWAPALSRAEGGVLTGVIFIFRSIGLLGCKGSTDNPGVF